MPVEGCNRTDLVQIYEIWGNEDPTILFCRSVIGGLRIEKSEGCQRYSDFLLETMTMKRLDDSTLETIAELVCGAGEGSGGGYQSPGPYRSMSRINAFFARAGVKPSGQSATRKWFVLESLQFINGTIGLERVLLRMASPIEYPGEPEVAEKVVDHLNLILQVEGLGVEMIGVEPRVRARAPSTNVSRSREASVESAPNFLLLVEDDLLAHVLSLRWQEAQQCVNAGAYLAAVVMMGSILEGALLYKVESNPRVANLSQSSPKDRRTGKPRPFQDWGLSALIDVAHDLGWLQGDVSRFSHALRESRNLVHPYMERLGTDRPDGDTCSICWQVVRAAVSDLLGMD